MRRGHVAANVAEIAKAPRLEEALGLHWEDVDLDVGYARIRKNRLRPKYAHGCGDNPCGRKAGYCPKRQRTRREHKSTKSHGLIGLRERAELLGGALLAEPTPQGGYEIERRAPTRPA